VEFGRGVAAAKRLVSVPRHRVFRHFQTVTIKICHSLSQKNYIEALPRFVSTTARTHRNWLVAAIRENLNQAETRTDALTRK